MDNLPQLGDVRKGIEIERRGYNRYIWAACIDCGKERWVRIEDNKPKHIYCRRCTEIRRRGQAHGKVDWKGGRKRDKQGYIEIRLYHNDFFYPMAKKNHYVFEHRLVMAKHLGRCLLRTEIVHHRPDVEKDDNRIEVLYLMPNPSEHNKLSPCSHCELKKEIRLLRWQIKELSARDKAIF